MRSHAVVHAAHQLTIHFCRKRDYGKQQLTLHPLLAAHVQVAAQLEYEELRAFLTQHNEALMAEARAKFQEALVQAQVEGGWKEMNCSGLICGEGGRGGEG